MAYNDYGAFVYKNGMRRRDREDVAVFDEGEIDTPSGHRIYKSMATSAGTSDAHEHLHHGVIGDGNVRIGLYKTGMGAIYVRDGMTGRVRRIDRRQIVEMALGDGFIPMPKAIDGAASKEEWDAHFQELAAFDEQFYGPYDYNIRFHGWDISFDAKGDEGGPALRPLYHVCARSPEGDIWECWYDCSYGSGHTDRGLDDHRFDVLGDGPMPTHTVLDVIERDGSLFDEERDVEAETSGVYREDGRILYRGEKVYTPDGYALETSTLGHDSFISPSDFIEILNMGIRLAREEGIDEVTWSSSGGRGGEFPKSVEDYAKIDGAYLDADADIPDDILDANRKVYELFLETNERILDRFPAKESAESETGGSE